MAAASTSFVSSLEYFSSLVIVSIVSPTYLSFVVIMFPNFCVKYNFLFFFFMFFWFLFSHQFLLSYDFRNCDRSHVIVILPFFF